MVEQHYRWDFIGLSTDQKPTPETSPKVVDGSTFYCADNSKLYVYCTNNWYERKPLGGGGGGGGDTGFTKLSSSNYNYDSGSGEFDSIDPFTLTTDIYLLEPNTSIYIDETEGVVTYSNPTLISVVTEDNICGICFVTQAADEYYEITIEDNERTSVSSYVIRNNEIEAETFTFTLLDDTTVEKTVLTTA